MLIWDAYNFIIYFIIFYNNINYMKYFLIIQELFFRKIKP